MGDVIIKNINKSFDNEVIFKDYSCIFKDNKITALLGESGRGKTTLLRIIAGLDIDYAGTVELNNQTIAYVFQEDRLLDWMSVYDNIAFVLKDKVLDYDEKVNQIIKAIGLEDDKDKFPSQLSGGMQRRVALGRAFVFESDILLLDEPFRGLNQEMKLTIARRFLSIAKEDKRTTIIVTHDSDIIEIAEKIIYI